MSWPKAELRRSNRHGTGTEQTRITRETACDRIYFSSFPVHLFDHFSPPRKPYALPHWERCRIAVLWVIRKAFMRLQLLKAANVGEFNVLATRQRIAD